MSTSTPEQEGQMSEASEARKFLFDLAFDDEAGLTVPAQPKPKVSYTEEELAEIKKASYDSGFAAGKNTMLDSQQQQMNQLLSEIEKLLTTLSQDSEKKWSDFLIQLQQITLVILRKIIPSYVEKNGVDEIDSLVSKTIAEMNQEPRLVIRVAESQFEEANEHINDLAKNQAYVGKIVLLGEADLAPSDCRIEWADGGIERNQEKMWEDITHIIDEQQRSCPPQHLQTTEEETKPEINVKAESEVPPEANLPEENTPEENIQAPSTTQPEAPSQPEREPGEEL